MRAYVLAFFVVAGLALAAPVAADQLHYWGLHPDVNTTGVIELNRQWHSVRVGDAIPAWGTVRAVSAGEIVVERALTDDEKGALRAQGKAVYEAQHLHVRNIQLMLPQPDPATP
jgi:hypothetical protein